MKINRAEAAMMGIMRTNAGMTQMNAKNIMDFLTVNTFL
jgi:hypothetical protein